MVFDSGAAITQVHTEIMNSVGCTEATKIGIVSIAGVTGHAEVGYEVRMDKFAVLGRSFGEARIAAIDFSRWQEDGLDGLLGWDFIRLFHFDMDGPLGKLEVF